MYVRDLSPDTPSWLLHMQLRMNMQVVWSLPYFAHGQLLHLLGIGNEIIKSHDLIKDVYVEQFHLHCDSFSWYSKVPAVL